MMKEHRHSANPFSITTVCSEFHDKYSIFNICFDRQNIFKLGETDVLTISVVCGIDNV